MFLYWCGGFKFYDILPVLLSSFLAILKHVHIVRHQLVAILSGIRKSHATSCCDWRLNPCWKIVLILCLWYYSSCCKWYPWTYMHISQLIFVMHWISLSVTSWLTFWTFIFEAWKVHMLFLWTNYLKLHHSKNLHTDPWNIVAVALGVSPETICKAYIIFNVCWQTVLLWLIPAWLGFVSFLYSF